MRSSGIRAEAIDMKPCDHIGWVHRGRDQFTALARAFLAEGSACGEKLLYVAEQPEPDGPAGLASTLAPSVLQVATIDEVYGSSGIVDAMTQRDTFAKALAAARAEGFTGIRVAADNTALVTDEAGFRAWLGWELAADQFMAANPVTGLCAFDRDRVAVDRLRHLATLHSLASASSPRPQFRMFVDHDYLRAEGIIDTLAVRTLRRALEQATRYLGLTLDMHVCTLMSTAVIDRLDALARSGVDVTVIADPESADPESAEPESAEPLVEAMHVEHRAIAIVHPDAHDTARPATANATQIHVQPGEPGVVAERQQS
jgi:hypothetical protein